MHPFGRVTGSQSGLGDSVCNKSWAEGAEVYQGILGVAAGVEGLGHYSSKGEGAASNHWSGWPCGCRVLALHLELSELADGHRPA